MWYNRKLQNSYSVYSELSFHGQKKEKGGNMYEFLFNTVVSLFMVGVWCAAASVAIWCFFHHHSLFSTDRNTLWTDQHNKRSRLFTVNCAVECPRYKTIQLTPGNRKSIHSICFSLKMCKILFSCWTGKNNWIAAITSFDLRENEHLGSGLAES